MKRNILGQYLALRASLKQERARILARIKRIDIALGAEAPGTLADAQAPARPKRKLSAANKAKLIAGIKARWARYRAEKAGKAAPRPVRKAKKHFSAAARAALSAAAKARWAKVKAAGKSKL